MSGFFSKQVSPRESRPPELPDAPHLRVVGVPPGESAKQLIGEFDDVHVDPQTDAAAELAESIEPAAPVEPVETAVDIQDGVGRGICAIRDGAPGVIAVTWLEGATWKHVIRTNDFPHREHGTSLLQWSQMLKAQRDESRREAGES